MRLTAVIAVALTSCSLLGTRRPDPPPYVERPECTDSYGRPIGDTFVAAAGLSLIALGAFMATRPPNPDGSNSVAGGVLGVASGVAGVAVFGTSAAIGYPRVSACADAVAEWNAGAGERTRLATEAAERARQAAAEGAAARRRELVAAAAAFLRCGEADLTVDNMSFDQTDPLRPRWGWAEVEVHGCNLAAWCGSPSTAGPECRYPNDYYVASAQLALETQCSEQKIAPQMQQVFSKRTWSAERGESAQISWRLSACGQAYTCSVTGGLAATVSCKVALSSQPAP